MRCLIGHRPGLQSHPSSVDQRDRAALAARHQRGATAPPAAAVGRPLLARKLVLLLARLMVRLAELLREYNVVHPFQKGSVSHCHLKLLSRSKRARGLGRKRGEQERIPEVPRSRRERRGRGGGFLCRVTSSRLDTSATLEKESVCHRRVPSRKFGALLQARQCISCRSLMTLPTFRPR